LLRQPRALQRFCRVWHKLQNDPARRVHRRHEAVSHSRQGFYVVRLIGDIAKRLPQLIDRRVEAVFEVTRGRSGPKAVAKIFTSYQLAGPIHQRVQNRARL
jgi:hypothetical protein